MLAQRDHNHVTVYKTRRCFLYNDQYFQMDIYKDPCHPRWDTSKKIALKNLKNGTVQSDIKILVNILNRRFVYLNIFETRIRTKLYFANYVFHSGARGSSFSKHTARCQALKSNRDCQIFSPLWKRWLGKLATPCLTWASRFVGSPENLNICIPNFWRPWIILKWNNVILGNLGRK